MSSLAVPVASSRAPLASSSSMAPARACIACGLVLGPLDRQADVAHLLGDAGERLADLGLRLGRGVGRLDRLLRVRKASTLACSRWEARVSFSSSACSVRVLGRQVGQLLLHARTGGSAPRGPGPRGPAASACRPCASSLSDCCCSCCICSSSRLRRGRHVGDSAAYLLQHLELLLVGVVEGLARVLGPVERLVRLGRKISFSRFMTLIGPGTPLRGHGVVRGLLHPPDRAGESRDEGGRPRASGVAATVGRVFGRSKTVRRRGGRADAARGRREGGKGRPTPKRREVERGRRRAVAAPRGPQGGLPAHAASGSASERGHRMCRAQGRRRAQPAGPRPRPGAQVRARPGRRAPLGGGVLPAARAGDPGAVVRRQPAAPAIGSTLWLVLVVLIIVDSVVLACKLRRGLARTCRTSRPRASSPTR